MFWRQKKVNTIQQNTIPVVNNVIFRQRVKRYWNSCGLQNIGQKPHEMPTWALNELATMGIAMIGHELALKHAESLAMVGIAPELPTTIKSMMR